MTIVCMAKETKQQQKKRDKIIFDIFNLSRHLDFPSFKFNIILYIFFSFQFVEGVLVYCPRIEKKKKEKKTQTNSNEKLLPELLLRRLFCTFSCAIPCILISMEFNVISIFKIRIYLMMENCFGVVCQPIRSFFFLFFFSRK